MAILYGSRLYGKVDEVPGLCHIATKFGHLYYFPLVPIGTYAVFEATGDRWKGAQIRFSTKSMLVAWVRVGLAIAAGGLGLSLVAFIVFSALSVADRGLVAIDAKMLGLLATGTGLAAIPVFLYRMLAREPRINHATYERALAIVRELGLGEQTRVMVDLSYGKITQSEADERLAALRARATHAT